MAYLVGPGRSNEHTDPHLVAGDPAVMAWHDDNELSGESGRAIAHHLDQPRRARGVEVKGGHVWHCSLSLPAREGQLSDDQWQQIASDFVAEMRWMVPAATQAPDAAREGALTSEHVPAAFLGSLCKTHWQLTSH